MYAKERLLYVDEAGVDDTEDYPYGWCEKGERDEELKLDIKRNEPVYISCHQFNLQQYLCSYF